MGGRFGSGVIAPPQEEPEYLSFREAFLKLEPLYLSYGMSREEYWHGRPDLARVYRELYQIRLHRRNEELWRQGQYTLAALNTALSAAFAKNKAQIALYPDEPFPLSEQEQIDQQIRKQRKEDERIKAALLARNRSIEE